MALTIPQMQAFPSGLEMEAAKYGMQLNEAKIKLLSSEPHPDPVFFESGETVESVEEVSVAKYPEFMISCSKPSDVAFHRRLGVAQALYKKMRLVWNCSMPRRLKLTLFMTNPST